MRKTIKKIMSSVLSAALAFGVCVPMASIAPVAYAATPEQEENFTGGSEVEMPHGDAPLDSAEKASFIVSAGEGGFVSPQGPLDIALNFPEDSTFPIALVPHDGYCVDYIEINGARTYLDSSAQMFDLKPVLSKDLKTVHVGFKKSPTIVLSAPKGVASGTTYDVYRVFKANVLGSVTGAVELTSTIVDEKYITDIEFAEGVEGLFDLSENQTAYDAAIALKDALRGDDGVAQGIEWAKKLTSQKVGTIVSDGDPLDVKESGYYLLVNTDEVNDLTVAVSYPIFVAVGYETLEITEKSSVPSITKYVKEDSNGEWQKYADFAKKDEQEFKFDITMPDGLFTYSKYAMKITDTTLHYMDMTDVVVELDGMEVSSEKYSYADGVFTFPNVLDLGVKISSFSVLTITYKAFANDEIDVPANNEAHTVDPYVNTVQLEYSNNPANEDSMGLALLSRTNEYSYGIRVKVEERITDAPLPGFGFTVADSDGNLVADADGNTTWMTNMEGVIELPYLDADDYTITCVEKAEGYDADVETFTLKLTPSYDDELGTLDEFGADVPEGFNAQRRAGVEKADNTWVLADGGYGNVTLSIPSNMNMPITGEGGYALIIAAGLALITVAVVRTYRSRRNTIA